MIACFFSTRYDMAMRYLFAILVLLCPFAIAAAHTSDERYADGYVVDLSTAPVAPWVGETIGMDVTFRDPKTQLATTSVVEASWEFVALMRANGKPQEVVFTKDAIPVANGGFNMSHTFSEEGTYDLHLTFKDKEGNTHVVGFRKQIRNGVQAQGMTPTLFVVTLMIVGIGMFLAGRLSTKRT